VRVPPDAPPRTYVGRVTVGPQGLPGPQRRRARAVDGFPKARVFAAGQPVSVAPDRGWLLEIGT
jgi:hypothetical protein